MYLKITNASIAYGSNTIIENMDLVIKNNEKIGLVGRNGTGKTSILKALTNEIEFEDGYDKISIQKDDFKIGYVEQNTNINSEVNLIDYIKEAYKEIIDIENELNKLEEKMSTSFDEKVLIKYNDLTEKYKILGGYEYKKEYTQALSKFGFKEEELTKKISEFSGGELTKILLVKLLLSKPDLLILDEPTNHLDVEGIEWLEKYLSEYKKSIILVSHDRMFLDNVCNVIYSIEFGQLKRYVGNYTKYLELREEEYKRNLKDYLWQQKEIKRLEELIARFKYKPTKAKMAMSRLKVLEKMTILEKPKKESSKTFNINFNPVQTSYREVLKTKNLKVGYTKELFTLDLNLEREDKLGIIGKNGTGKSTLVKTLIGEINPISGKIIYGNNITVSYFSQKLDNLNPKNTIFDEIREEFKEMSPEEVRNLLGAFDFTGEEVFKKIKDLSGGEKVRVSLCKILYSRPNLLILDEPTNHLDILNKEQIEKLLKSYKGTLIIVSHDRYLIKNICSKLLVIENGKSTLYNYGYDEYIEKKQIEANNKEEKITKPKKAKETKKDNTKQIKELEKEINRLDKKVEELKQSLLNEEVYMDYEKSNFTNLQIENLNKILEVKMNEWEKLLNEE